MSDKQETPPSDQPDSPQPDVALSESHADGVVDSIDRNRNLILALVAGVAIALCAVLVFRQLGKEKHLEAGTAYSAAAAEKSVPALEAVVADYPGSIAAGNALLTKAELLLDQGKDADALATLKQFTTDFAEHPRHAQGVFAIGNAHQAAGNDEAAGEWYQKVLAEQPDGELSPLARIRLGDIALAGGDKQLAEQRYEESLTQHPGNPFVEIAEEKIALLKVGDPPVVDPPAEPEPAEDEAKDGEAAGKNAEAKTGEKEKENAKTAPKPEAKAEPGQERTKREVKPLREAKPRQQADKAKPNSSQKPKAKPEPEANAPKAQKEQAKAAKEPQAKAEPKAAAEKAADSTKE